MSGRRLTFLLDAWPALLAVILLGPLWVNIGHPLARDMMWLPNQALGPDAWGLGTGSPRAVPLDGIIGSATTVVDGAVVARVALLGALWAAGAGAHRLVSRLSTPARFAAAGFAVWNPFVVERLALGQWALVLGYACLPWILVASHQWITLGSVRGLANAVFWTGLASVTPTGGLLAAMALGVVGLRRSLRSAILLGCGFLLQLPWLVAGIVGAAGSTSDPAGVEAFAANSEWGGTAWISLLGLGGIWDARSVPSSRETFLAGLTALVVVLALALGWKALAVAWGQGFRRAVVCLAVGGWGLAGLALWPLGGDLLRWAMVEVPGAGLLRDGQKFLAPFVVLSVASFAAAVDRVWAQRHKAHGQASSAIVVGLVVLPLCLMPDATRVVWPVVSPVNYPDAFDEMEATIARGTGGCGDIVTLPWRGYRNFAWGSGLVSADPAGRWFDRDVLVSDDLLVGEITVRGEDVRAQRFATELRQVAEDQAMADLLLRSGIAWVVVYKDDPGAPNLRLNKLDMRVSSPYMALYAVPGEVECRPGPGTGAVVAIALANGFGALIWMTGVFLSLRMRRSSKQRQPDNV